MYLVCYEVKGMYYNGLTNSVRKTIEEAGELASWIMDTYKVKPEQIHVFELTNLKVRSEMRTKTEVRNIEYRHVTLE